MTIQPTHKRIDPAVVIRDGIRTGDGVGRVEFAWDADYNPDELLTVVQIVSSTPIGSLPGQRWAFQVRVNVITTGPDYDAAADEADRVADAMLAITDVGDVLVSSVMCDGEPVRLSPHDPSGAEALTSTYSAILRRKGRA